MAIYKVQAPDGRVLQLEGPDGATQEDIIRVAQSLHGGEQAPAVQSQQPEEAGALAQLGMGALRGAGSIGATLLTPVDAAARALGVDPNSPLGSIVGRTDRRQQMTEALKSFGANPESLAFQGGKLGAEIAGTLPVGGILGKGAQTLGAAPAFVQALRTGGMSAGGMKGISGLAARSGAGAATGAAAAGLVNPEQAGTGAMIGAALPPVVQALKAVPSVTRRVLGATTGVGDEAIGQAYQAGKSGGERSKAFAQALRGESSMDDVLTAAKQNLQKMGAQKQGAYREGMAGIKSDKSVLDLSGIRKAADDAMGMATYKGQVKNEPAAKAIQQIKDEVKNWASLDPAEYHTPEGLDALKQKIGGIIEGVPFEQKTARAAAEKVYNAVKGEISKQAPTYSNVMKDYSQASETIGEIEKALSLGKKASADIGMRKLQSLMRNNVNTSYGYRTNLAKQLEEAGGQELMPSLAGQALNEWAPRGIQKAAAGTGGLGLALTGNVPAAAGMAALSSPRLVGEASYGAGKVAGKISPALIEALKTGAVKGSPILGIQE